ncbi:MAG TPA: RIP metalloprotease RseP [Terriglobales bacterium]|nr:RIP metalloprotease RseP [Terriglobales bacterium]
MEAILSAIVVLGFLIVFHELGHFLVAKRCGVSVLKFSIGFGPKLFGRKFGETEYVVSAIPLGGFVKMVGEDPDEELTPEEQAVSFQGKGLLQRTAIVIAGPAANLLFALIVFTLVFAVYGARLPSDAAKVGGVNPGDPAATAGLQAGDLITKVDGAPVESWDKLSEIIRGSGGRTLNLTVDRGGSTVELAVTPQAKPDRTLFGETIGDAFFIGIERGFDQQDVGFVEAMQYGGSQTLWWMKTLVMSIVKMLQGRIPADQIGGPILIVQQAGQQAKLGFENLLNFMAVISINLGVLNLLPIPVLDGGHLFFFAIEGILRRPLQVRHREIANQVGLVVLITLMAFAFYNDIARNIGDWWG